VACNGWIWGYWLEQGTRLNDFAKGVSGKEDAKERLASVKMVVKMRHALSQGSSQGLILTSAAILLLLYGLFSHGSHLLEASFDIIKPLTWVPYTYVGSASWPLSAHGWLQEGQRREDDVHEEFTFPSREVIFAHMEKQMQKIEAAASLCNLTRDPSISWFDVEPKTGQWDGWSHALNYRYTVDDLEGRDVETHLDSKCKELMIGQDWRKLRAAHLLKEQPAEVYQVDEPLKVIALVFPQFHQLQVSQLRRTLVLLWYGPERYQSVCSLFK
jgi:hypothetical protein